MFVVSLILMYTGFLMIFNKRLGMYPYKLVGLTCLAEAMLIFVKFTFNMMSTLSIPWFNIIQVKMTWLRNIPGFNQIVYPIPLRYFNFVHNWYAYDMLFITNFVLCVDLYMSIRNPFYS